MPLFGPKIRHVATVFVDASDWVPTGEDAARLLDELQDQDLLPVPVPRATGEEDRTRMGFSSEDRGKRLWISEGRIDYEWRASLYEQGNLGSLEEFCAQASSRLDAVMGHLGRRGQQLGVFQEGFLHGGPRLDMHALAARLFHLPPTFEHHRPFDWDYRLAARIERAFGSCSQGINTLVSLQRRRVTFAEDHDEERQDTEQVIVYMETNTGAEPLQARFAGNDVLAYFAAAPRWHHELELEMQEFLEIA